MNRDVYLRIEVTGIQYHTFIGTEDFELLLMTTGTTSGVKVLQFSYLADINPL